MLFIIIKCISDDRKPCDLCSLGLNVKVIKCLSHVLLAAIVMLPFLPTINTVETTGGSDNQDSS